MASPNKKRSAFEMTDDEEDLSIKIERLEQEVKNLRQENEAFQALKLENETLKQKIAEYEEDSDDDDEGDGEDSVCDGSPWSVKYHLLKQYKQQNGHCKVPRSDKDLGVWVNNAKAHRRKNKLPQDRIDKLDKIGFSWGKGFPEPATWDDRFGEMKTYYDTFGNCNIQVHEDPSLRNALAKWVLEQRKQGKRLKKSQPSEMTQEQWKRLNDMEFFKWKTRKPRR